MNSYEKEWQEFFIPGKLYKHEKHSSLFCFIEHKNERKLFFLSEDGKLSSCYMVVHKPVETFWTRVL